MTVALVLAVLAAWIAVLRGGSLDRLAATKFRWLALLFAALLVQVVFAVWQPPWLTDAGALAVILGSMVGVAVFLTINRHLAGTLIAALGLALNVLVIGANGAMPVSDWGARAAAADPEEIGGIKHERMTNETVFPWLGDVIPIPRWTVISIGDVILALGVARLTYSQTRHGDLGAPRRARRSGGAPSTRRDATGAGSEPAAPPAPPPLPRRRG